MFSFVPFLEQELEQELAEQKSLLRSVASRGEEILTQQSAAETSGGLGYVSKHLNFLFLFPFFWHVKKCKHLTQNFILNICNTLIILCSLHIKFTCILNISLHSVSIASNYDGYLVCPLSSVLNISVQRRLLMSSFFKVN